MRREEVLEYETRRRLYELICKEPGLHLRELERRSKIPLGTLRHHIRFLLEHRLIEAAEDRNVVRHFATVDAEPRDRRAISALRQGSLRRVVIFLLARGGAAMLQEMQGDLELPASTLSVYLAELTRRGVLVRRSVGREARYEVVDLPHIVRLLHTYRSSFLDAWVDHLLDLVYSDEST